MAPLSFNVIGFTFVKRMKALYESYRVAAKELTISLGAKVRQLEDYKLGVTNGSPPIEERDEDGYLLWSQEQVLELDIDAINDALHGLRNSFAIAVFHAWEASIQMQSRFKAGEKATIKSYNELVKAASLMNIQVQPELRKICTLVNLLKHQNPILGKNWRLNGQKYYPAMLRLELMSIGTKWFDLVTQIWSLFSI